MTYFSLHDNLAKGRCPAISYNSWNFSTFHPTKYLHCISKALFSNYSSSGQTKATWRRLYTRITSNPIENRWTSIFTIKCVSYWLHLEPVQALLTQWKHLYFLLCPPRSGQSILIKAQRDNIASRNTSFLSLFTFNPRDCLQYSLVKT